MHGDGTERGRIGESNAFTRMFYLSDGIRPSRRYVLRFCRPSDTAAFSMGAYGLPNPLSLASEPVKFSSDSSYRGGVCRRAPPRSFSFSPLRISRYAVDKRVAEMARSAGVKHPTGGEPRPLLRNACRNLPGALKTIRNSRKDPGRSIYLT